MSLNVKCERDYLQLRVRTDFRPGEFFFSFSPFELLYLTVTVKCSFLPFSCLKASLIPGDASMIRYGPTGHKKL